jgi:hypothetical protein
MGERGPIPNRSDQRRRRNKTWIDRVQAAPPGPAAPEEPPRTGKGSSAQVWREYAAGLGHDVPAGATRAEIIVMVDEGLPEEAQWHPLARDWYRSLAASAQARFYQPSDWQTARVLAEALTRALRGAKINAALFARWQTGATELLTTEGSRRRMQMEIADPAAESPQSDVDDEVAEQRRRRAEAAALGK